MDYGSTTIHSANIDVSVSKQAKSLVVVLHVKLRISENFRVKWNSYSYTSMSASKCLPFISFVGIHAARLLQGRDGVRCVRLREMLSRRLWTLRQRYNILIINTGNNRFELWWLFLRWDSGHNYRLFLRYSRLNIRNHLFSERVDTVWNNLECNVVDFSSFRRLKMSPLSCDCSVSMCTFNLALSHHFQNVDEADWISVDAQA